jgi:4-amino-4-deoxy-L-arabinose transferase-like glycosyltransferase
MNQLKENKRNMALDLNKTATRLKECISSILSRIDLALESITQKDIIFYTFLIALFVMSLAIRLHFSFITPIIREDALFYLNTAEQILQEDFTSWLGIEKIGFSIWESIFILLLGSGEILKDISIVKALSAVTGTLVFIPLALISRKLFNRNVMIISVVLFTFQPWLIKNVELVYTEPLFTLIILTTFYFLLKSTDHRYNLLVASVVASLSFWVRPNGILLLPILLIYAILIRKDIPKWKNRYLVYTVLVFIIVSFPYLCFSWLESSSPTYFDLPSYFFAESLGQAKSPGYEGQSIFQFLATHVPSDILKRELIGLRRTLDAAISNMLIPLVGFAIIGLIYTFRRRCSFIHITYGIWILSFSWRFYLCENPRHFIPLVPLAIILAAFTIVKVSKETKFKYLTISIILCFLVAMSGAQLVKFDRDLQYKGAVWEDGMEWAQWVSTNIEPEQSIFIEEGGDLIRLCSPIRKVKMPLCGNLSATMKALQAEKTNYLAIGDRGYGSPDWVTRPELKEVYFGEYIPKYLELVYTNMDSDSNWKMQIYRINWGKFNNKR